MELTAIWEDYGLDRLEQGLQQLFPENNLSFETLFGQVIQGKVWEAICTLFQESMKNLQSQMGEIKGIFVWLIVLGIVSSLITHFAEIFDKHQIADMSFYFMYLLFGTILLKSFSQSARLCMNTMENIVAFVKIMVPAYLMSVGVAGGTLTAGATYQLLLFVVYGVESILKQGVIPLVYSFLMLSVMNGIWPEEKLALLLELMQKCINWVLKGSMGVVTGISVFQSLITPVLDSVRRSTLEKVIQAVPGIGGAAGSVTELVLGSALVIKNSIGVVFLILLIMLCIIPLIRIGITAFLFKLSAAFIGIVSDKRIVSFANRAGDAGLMLFKTAGTSLFLFWIAIAVMTAIRR